MVDFVARHGFELVQGVLAVLGGFSMLAKITPTPKDDRVIDKILGFIHLLGLTKK